jgi:hypothetical protein
MEPVQPLAAATTIHKENGGSAFTIALGVGWPSYKFGAALRVDAFHGEPSTSKGSPGLEPPLAGPSPPSASLWSGTER